MKHTLLTQKVSLAFLLLIGLTTLNACDGDETTEPAPATGTAPTALLYTPNSITLEAATAGSSTEPSIEGSTPITYSISVSPQPSGLITIDETTGVISAANRLDPGTYVITVTATNDFGSKTFGDAFTINVTALKKITFTDDIQPIIMSSCSPCHAYGGSEKTYVSSYDNAKADIDNIINRINRDQGTAGFMPMSGTKLDAATIALFEQWKTEGLLEK